jgi:ABC-2 type transport system ATP-binding protein
MNKQTMSSALLSVADMHKQFEDVHALRGVDLRLERGSIGLLGPNGAGKSTLFKIILGLLRATRGEARVLDLDPISDPIALRERVGYMPEQESYLAGLDAVELCTYAAQLCGLPATEARQRANAVLSFVGLEDKRYMKVQTYSTGQKQRVKLAQALVHDPELLLLDEPTNGLDPQGRNEMLTLINQLPERRGCSVILSSHLLPDVEAVCEDVVVLAEGQVRYCGSLDALRKQDVDSYAVEAKGDVERFKTLLFERGCSVKEQAGKLQVELPPGQDTDLILAQSVAANVQIRHLARAEVSLEAAFIDVVRATESTEAS